MKEADATVHSVLNDLFTPLTKKRTMELGLSEEEESRYVHRLSRDIEGAGRDSAIATGRYRRISSEESISLTFTCRLFWPLRHTSST